MDTVSIIALSMGAAWASGINLYATIFMLGYLGTTGNIDLPPDLMNSLPIKHQGSIPHGIPCTHLSEFHLVQCWLWVPSEM